MSKKVTLKIEAEAPEKTNLFLREVQVSGTVNDDVPIEVASIVPSGVVVTIGKQQYIMSAQSIVEAAASLYFASDGKDGDG